jgi:hypothetical protein
MWPYNESENDWISGREPVDPNILAFVEMFPMADYEHHPLQFRYYVAMFNYIKRNEK